MRAKAIRWPQLAFREVCCPCCSSSDYILLSQEDRHRIGLRTVLCRHCGLAYMNPMPDDDSLSRFYENDYRKIYRKKNEIGERDIDNLGVAERSKETALFISRHLTCTSKIHILDIGCGDGSLLKAFREICQVSVVGVEPNSTYRSFAAKRVAGRFFSSLQDVEAGDGFDLITLNHVLEHTSDPVGYLMKIRKCLKETGLLYVDVPDVCKYGSIEDIHVAHLLHFTEISLINVMRLAGFEIELIEAHSPHSHPDSLRLIAKFGVCGQQLIDAPAREYIDGMLNQFDKINARVFWFRFIQAISPYISVGMLRRASQRIRSRLNGG